MATTPRGVPYADLTDAADAAATTQEQANFIDAEPGIRPYTTAQRDALSAAQKPVGLIIWNVTEGVHQKWDGAGWIDDHTPTNHGSEGDPHTQYALDEIVIPKTIGVAKGDLISFTDAAEPERIGVGSEGQIPIARAAASAGIAWESWRKTAIKAADEQVVNSAVLQDDDTLVLPYLPDEVWTFEMAVYYDSPGAGDFKFTVDVTAAVSVMRWGFVGQELLTTNRSKGALTPGEVMAVEEAQGGGALALLITGSLVAAGSAGNLVFRWAQNTPNITPTIVRAGSYLRALRN